jgi:hypothetical protein
MSYDAICESTQDSVPGEARGAGDRAVRDVPTHAAAREIADDYVERYGHLPDVRVLILDNISGGTTIVHQRDG